MFAFLDNHDFLIATSVLFWPIKSKVVKYSHFTARNLVNRPMSLASSWHTVFVVTALCEGTQSDPAIKLRNVTIYWPVSACVCVSSLFSNVG